MPCLSTDSFKLVGIQYPNLIPGASKNVLKKFLTVHVILKMDRKYWHFLLRGNNRTITPKTHSHLPENPKALSKGISLFR